MSTSSSSSTWASLVSPVKTHLTTLLPPSPPPPSPQGEQLRTGKSDVYQQPIASLSPESSWVKEDPPPRSRDNVFVSVSHSYDKTSRLSVQTKRCWTLAEDLLSEWEERKKSRAGGGAPCESRKIVFCALLLWQAIPATIRLQRGCWATSGRRRSRRALQVLVMNCFSWCVSPGIAFQLNICYNTHGHVSVFSEALLVCLVRSYRCGYVVL